MTRAPRENSRALVLTLLGLILSILLLETRGLLAWAERLEVGYFRAHMLEVGSVLEQLTEPTGVPAVRSLLLQSLTNQRHTEPEPLQDTVEVAATPDAAAQVQAPDETAATATAVPQPLVGAALPPKPATSASGPAMTVVVVGDSMMAVGLAPYLLRELSAMPGITVVKAVHSGTGLARPEVFDWFEQYPLLVGAVKPDLIICAIGANDAQSFMLGKKAIAFGSEDWVHEYQRRVTAFVETIAPGDTPLLWMALPSMRNDKFSRHVRQLNDIVKDTLSRKPNITWLESNPLLGGGENTYVEFQPNAQQKLERLRQVDGVHLSMAGAERVGRDILQWVNQWRR